jgi:hypothetical protein
MHRIDLGKIALEAIAAVLIIVLMDVTVASITLFNNAATDQLQRADAIVVLSGEHDGREDYALRLGRDGWAPTVLISNAYAKNDELMKRVCGPAPGIEVICRRPVPLTTRGEAVMARSLAEQRSWKRIIVVTWRYHTPRARLVFRQCYANRPGVVIMPAMPREYHYSVLQWEFIYFYQFAGFAKAILKGSCG